jgi:pectinesterase
VPLRQEQGQRVVIQLRPGVYRERVCVPAGKAPITLVGDPDDAERGHRHRQRLWRPGQACQRGHRSSHASPISALPIVGTLGSATMIVAADDFQALHLTIANDALEQVRWAMGYPPGPAKAAARKAVALTVQADRVQLTHVRLLGHQDTLHGPRARAGFRRRGSTCSTA